MMPLIVPASKPMIKMRISSIRHTHTARLHSRSSISILGTQTNSAQSLIKIVAVRVRTNDVPRLLESVKYSLISRGT
jgi:hypothetical protein